MDKLVSYKYTKERKFGGGGGHAPLILMDHVSL